MGECRDYAEKYTVLFVLGLSLEQGVKIYCHKSRLARSGAGSNPGKSHSMNTLLDIGPEYMLRPMGELASPAPGFPGSCRIRPCSPFRLDREQ